MTKNLNLTHEIITLPTERIRGAPAIQYSKDLVLPLQNIEIFSKELFLKHNNLQFENYNFLYIALDAGPEAKINAQNHKNKNISRFFLPSDD